MATLLWLNMLMAAAASTVWSMWAKRWWERRDPILFALYLTAAIGTLVAAVGFGVVVLSDDIRASATVARYSVPFSIGLPAAARLIELLRDERRNGFAETLLDRVEARADAYDHAQEQNSA